MKNRFNLLYDTENTWKKIKRRNFTVPQIYLRFLLVMALIPVVCGYIGTVYIGWKIGFSTDVLTKLTPKSALMISVAAYFGILIGAYIFAYLVHWMAKTYRSTATFAECFILVAYSCVPLLLASFVSIYPILWLDTLITLGALAMAVRILFIGTPIMMDINEDRGFLFSNSILAVSMVLAVGAIAITVLFWGAGIGPEFLP